MQDERLCPSCGKAALPVATRCPKCGYAFELRYERPRPDTSRRTGLFAGLLFLVIVALVASNALRRRGTARPRETPQVAGMPAPVAPATDSGARVTVTSPRTGSVSPAPAPAPVAQAPPPNPAPTAVRANGRRYATTWINVRSARNNRAPVVRVLKPGEAVSIDSLDQGWYQVVTADRVQGYADRRLLSDSPPARGP